jgi:hypothetical protein
MTVEYILAAVLNVSCLNSNQCMQLVPGQRYESLSPTQRPNWCVVNRNNARSPIKFQQARGGMKMYLGQGVEPCDDRRRTPTS